MDAEEYAHDRAYTRKFFCNAAKPNLLNLFAELQISASSSINPSKRIMADCSLSTFARRLGRAGLAPEDAASFSLTQIRIETLGGLTVALVIIPKNQWVENWISPAFDE